METMTTDYKKENSYNEAIVSNKLCFSNYS